MVLDPRKNAKLQYGSEKLSKNEPISWGKGGNRVGLGLDSELGSVNWAKIWLDLMLQFAKWVKIRFWWDQGLGLKSENKGKYA